MKISFTKCDCGKIYLVGFKGKDLRSTKPISGSCDGVGYIGFDNPSIAKAPPIMDDETECLNCGEICKIVHTESGGMKQ